MKDYGQQRGKDNNTGNSTSSSSKPLASAIVVVGEASESEEEDYDDEEDYDEDEDYDDEEDEEEGEDDFVDAPPLKKASKNKGKGKKTSIIEWPPLPPRQLPANMSMARRPRGGRRMHIAANSEDDTSEHPNAGQRNRAGRRGRRRATSTTASAGQDKTLSDSTSMQSPKDGLNRDAAAASLKQASTKDSLLHSLLRESNASLKSHLLQLSCTPYANASKDVGRITRSLIVSQRGLQSAATTLQKTANDIHQLNRAAASLATFMAVNSRLLK
ncbi:hypothetical protein TYRP_006723 [Tyrophagus putrescentiae]|nr:hypothetical protein TYRP_006723 [Tyrophagus putrescentiae]